VNCRECGTEFPAAPASEPRDTEITAKREPAGVAEPLTSLTGLDMGFELSEGFSRPNWRAIWDFVKAHVPADDQSAAVDYITARWLQELAQNLGGGAQVHRSGNFYCLSDLEAKTTDSLLKYAESALDTVRGYLGKAAWSGYRGRHVLLFFSDPDDYYAYVSYYYRDGTHILSGGIFLRGGYAHIALPYHNTLTAQHTLPHELTHNLLCHLPIPLWLNEGLAVVLEGMVTRRAFLMDRELADRHRNHWNETNIQAFWAGKTFDNPGDDSQLSYNLGSILVGLLSEQGADFAEFIRAADWRDAGQDAAVNFLGHGLEETVAGFLGPGNWRPQRRAIKEILNVGQTR
jgi:hypothetical protein